MHEIDPGFKIWMAVNAIEIPKLCFGQNFNYVVQQTELKKLFYKHFNTQI